VLPPRLVAFLKSPVFLVALVYVVGVALRLEYTLHFHRPEAFVESDMHLYVTLARRLAGSSEPLMPWHVTHPLGYPALVAYLTSDGGSLATVTNLQIVVSSLVPLALGLLGAAAFGRATALMAIVIGSIYFPFIEYGALFLSEIHFIFWLALAFAAFFAAIGARRRGASLGFAAAGGVALSIAISMKSVGLLAAVTFFAVEAIAILLARRPGGPSWRARLRPWLLRGVVVAVAAAPLLIVLARVCTGANRGNFCVTGNKVGSDFLLGHYGRIADMAWAPEDGNGFQFGSPSAFLRHYTHTARVPFPMTDNAANTKEAWRWIFGHPLEAVVLSFDHIYDTFFGAVMWPSFNHKSWPYAHIAQYAFVVLLFIPVLFACRRVATRGARALVTSRTALVLSPVLALTVTVAIATGEVRYRIPFDIFFIVVMCAFAVGDLTRVDGKTAAG
jgi:4-amino-4-deoxy-L-arabinose transferase-like glycosyltransferase